LDVCPRRAPKVSHLVRWDAKHQRDLASLKLARLDVLRILRSHCEWLPLHALLEDGDAPNALPGERLLPALRKPLLRLRLHFAGVHEHTRRARRLCKDVRPVRLCSESQAHGVSI